MKRHILLLGLVFAILVAGCTQKEAETIKLKFEPKQCEQEPWDSPTASAVESYYKERGIDIDVELVEREGAVCLACGLCPKSYYYEASVPPSYERPLSEDGWVSG